MISEKKIINEENRGKIKEKDYIISSYASILNKKKIFKYIIFILTIIII